MVCTRLPTAFLVLFRGGFTWREQVFMACSWTPKVAPCMPPSPHPPTLKLTCTCQDFCEYVLMQDVLDGVWD